MDFRDYHVTNQPDDFSQPSETSSEENLNIAPDNLSQKTALKGTDTRVAAGVLLPQKGKGGIKLLLSLKFFHARLAAAVSHYMKLVFDPSGRNIAFEKRINEEEVKAKKGEKRSLKSDSELFDKYVNFDTKLIKEEYSQKIKQYLSKSDLELVKKLLHTEPVSDLAKDKKLLKLYMLLTAVKKREKAHINISNVVSKISQEINKIEKKIVNLQEESKNESVEKDLKKAVKLLQKVDPEALKNMSDKNITSEMRVGTDRHIKHPLLLTHPEIEEFERLFNFYLPKSSDLKENPTISEENSDEEINISNEDIGWKKSEEISEEDIESEEEDVPIDNPKVNQQQNFTNKKALEEVNKFRKISLQDGDEIFSRKWGYILDRIKEPIKEDKAGKELKNLIIQTMEEQEEEFLGELKNPKNKNTKEAIALKKQIEGIHEENISEVGKAKKMNAILKLLDNSSIIWGRRWNRPQVRLRIDQQLKNLA